MKVSLNRRVFAGILALIMLFSICSDGSVRTVQAATEAEITTYDISDLINQDSLTITEHTDAIGNRWGQSLGTGLTENMSVRMKVDTGTATSGKYSLALCRSTGTNLWDGYGYYFDVELEGKVAFFIGNDWAGQTTDVTIPTGEPYILEYGIVNLTDGTGAVTAKKIFIKINDEEVYSYTDTAMSVACGNQLSLYTTVLPLTLQAAGNNTSEEAPTQYDISDLINQNSLTITEHSDAIGNRWGQSLGTGLAENMSVKMKVDTGTATSGKYSLALCRSTGTNLWDGYGYYFDVELEGKVAFFIGNDWAGQTTDVTIPTGEPYILEYGIVNLTGGTGAVTAKRIFIKINDVEVYSYTDTAMSVACGDQLSVYTTVFPLTLQTAEDTTSEETPTQYDISDLTNQTSLIITEHSDAIGNRWGQSLGTGLTENMSVRMKVDTGTATSGKYSLALCRSTGTNLWDGYGYYFDVELEGKIAFFIGNDWAGQTTDVTIPTGEPYLLEYGIVNITDGTGAVTAKRIFIKINDVEVYSYTDTAMSIACGDQLSAYTTVLPLTLQTAEDITSEAPATQYDFYDITNKASMTITEHSDAIGNRWGQPLGTGLAENMSVKMKVDTGTATSGKYSLGLCRSTGTNFWDGYGYYFDVELEGKIAFFIGNDWAGQTTDVTIPTGEPYLLEYGIVNITDGTGAVTAKRIFIKINDEEVYSYTDTAMSVACGDQLSVYTTVLPLTLQTTNYNPIGESVPEDVVFEDLGITLEKNTLEIPTKEFNWSLGQVSSEKTGFAFKLKVPEATSGNLFVGLYNTTKDGAPWANGYILDISATAEVGTLGFKLRNGANHEDVLADIGNLQGLGEDEITIHAWIKDNVLYIAINEMIVLTHTNDSSLTVGKYMSAYNEWSHNAIIQTLTEIYNPIGEKVPEDVSFEDIGITLEKNTAEIPTKEFNCSLGQVSSEQTGFAFKLKVPETTSGSLFVGLYNTAQGDVWSKGYILDIAATAETGTLGFKLRNGANHEDVLDAPGDLKIDGDEITVHAWLKDDTIYIAINGSVWLTHTNDGSLTMGKYMSVYNEWSHQATIQTLTEVYTPIGEKVPQNVAFEDIGVILSKNQIGVATKGYGHLGQVSSKETGFAFKVKVPETTSGSLFVGLYNTTQDGAPWANGYILDIAATAGSGTIGLTLRNGAKHEDVLDALGNLKIDGDEITIHAWIKDNTIYIAVDGSVCLTHTNKGSLVLGKHMSAYNEWSHQATIQTLKEVYDPIGEKVPKDIAFEDIGITLGKNKVSVATKGYGHLGNVNSEKTGFAFKVKVPETTSGSLFVGLYNTTKDGAPWANGYILDIAARAESGTLGFTLRNGAKHEDVLDAPGDLKIDGDEIIVHAWIKDKTLYVAINGSIWLTHTNNGSLTMGTYMSAYNEWSHQATIQTLTEVYDPFGEKVPEDVEFEDIGITLKKNKLVFSNKEYGNLGQVSSTQKGFAFKLKLPEETTRSLHIGLYNNEQANPWRGGYILDIAAGAEPGTFAFTLRKGQDHSALDYPGDLKIDGDEITVHVWIKDNTMHVAINGIIWLTHANSKAIALGTYMSVYSDWAQSITIQTLTETMEPGELYLSQFGDPKAMKDVDDSVNNETPNEKFSYWPYVVIGVSSVVLIGAIVLVLIKRKKR